MMAVIDPFSKSGWISIHGSSMVGNWMKVSKNVVHYLQEIRRSALGLLVNKPFQMWVKVTKVVDGHASNT